MPGHVRTAETNGVNTVGDLRVCTVTTARGDVSVNSVGQLRRARVWIHAYTQRLCVRVAARLAGHVTVIFFVPHNERHWLATWPGTFTPRLHRNGTYYRRYEKKRFLVLFLLTVRNRSWWLSIKFQQDSSRSFRNTLNILDEII